MSGKNDIEKVILEFLNTYKRYKNKKYQPDREKGANFIIRRAPRKREKLDSRPC
jgi:hypothetical protein